MKRMLAIALVAALLPVSIATAQDAKFNEKFTFDDVTYSDGTTGVIEAGSKRTGGGSEFTNCTFFSADYGEVLGYYQSAEFASSDAGVVGQFCLDHFDDRET